MNPHLVLTEDQTLLAESATEFANAEAPLSRFRAQRDAGHTRDPELWGQLVDLGWGGLALMGLPELAVVMEVLGRTLVQTPLISLAASAVLEEGEDGAVLAFAFDGRFTRDGDRIHGVARGVLDAGSASALAVFVDDQMFRLDLADVNVSPLTRIDFRDAADIRIEGATATPIPGRVETWSRCRDAATVAQCAEMLGTMSAAFEMTLAYLKEREQFGVKIGSFQALQHRAVDLFTEIELSRTGVMAAARDPRPTTVSLAKARCNDALMKTCNEAVQLHGGIGMTDEHDIGFFLKRARVASRTLGTSAWHRDRYARERGY